MSFFEKIYLSFTSRERIAFIASGALAIISFVIVIGISIAHGTRAIPAAGGQFTEGMTGQPEYLNPVIASSETDLDLVKLIYSNVPAIADSIQASPDGKTWTVRLKDNLYWQDGQKLTSDDVIFTVQMIQDPDADSPEAQSFAGVTVNRVSELELQFTLASPYAFFGDTLQNLYVIPKHLFADIPPGNWRLSDYNLKPVGSGPYQFASYDKGPDGFIASYNLAAWNDSWSAKPLIQNFDFSFARNQAALLAAFNAGQIDGFAAGEANQTAGITRPYNLFSWRTPAYYAVFFNQSQNLALQDPVVRNALSTAIDRAGLVNTVLAGQGVADYGPIPPDAAYGSPVATTTSLALASTTLTNAKWTIGADGFRSKTIQKSTVPLTVNLTVPDIDFLVATAQVLQSTWLSIGVSTTIATDSPQTIDSDVITNRSYESLLFGNILGPSSDLYAFWDSSQRFSPGANLAIYSNPAVDKLIENARSNMDNASRTAELAAAQNDIVSDAPAVFLYSPNDLYVANKDVQGITSGLLADPSDRFLEVPNWYIETARVIK